MTKNSLIKIACLALTVMLVIGMLPVSAFAAGESVITGTFIYMPAFVSEPAAETFYYSDSWFAAPSTEPNTHLTTMSMALAYASMEITAVIDSITTVIIGHTPITSKS